MRYPEAQSVEEPLILQQSVRFQRGRWFVYSGPELDARVLGRGNDGGSGVGPMLLGWLRNARRRARLVVAE